MAVERRRQLLTIDLSKSVTDRLASLDKTKQTIRAQQETDFQNRILKDNLSLADQKAYRDAQIATETGRTNPDNAYILTLRSEAANLDKRIRWQAYQDDFNKGLTEYKAGRESANKYLSDLKDSLLRTTDLDIQNDLKSKIADAEGAVVSSYQNMIDNKIEYAKTNQNTDAYNEAINLVQDARVKAIGSGNLDLASAYDVKLSNLQNELNVVKTKDEETDVDIKVLGGGDITQKLDWLTSKSATARAAGPFVYDGVKYDSEQQFWQGKMYSFIQGDYLKKKEDDFAQQAKNIYTRFGDINTAQLSGIRADVDKIFNRPELAPYKDTLALQFKNDTLNKVTDLKLSNLKDRLALESDPTGIANIANEVRQLQATVPEISQSPAYLQLQKQYADTMSGILKNKVDIFKQSRQDEINMFSQYIANDPTIDENTRNTYKNTLVQKQNELNRFDTRLALQDVPASQFGFDKSINQYLTDFLKNTDGTSGLLQPINLPGLNLQEYQRAILGGARENQNLALGVGDPNAPKQGAAPKPTPTPYGLPPAPGSLTNPQTQPIAQVAPPKAPAAGTAPQALPSGYLVRDPSTKKVYFTDNGGLRYVANSNVFGNDWSKVIDVKQDYFKNAKVGATISTAPGFQFKNKDQGLSGLKGFY